MQRMVYVIAPILAIVLEDVVFEELAGQQFVGMKDDLMVLSVVTPAVVAFRPLSIT